jgi:hypothetical protein
MERGNQFMLYKQPNQQQIIERKMTITTSIPENETATIKDYYESSCTRSSQTG